MRTATDSDVDALVRLRIEMFADMGVVDLDGPWLSATRSWFAERIAHPDYRLAVADAGGEVVACAVAGIRDAAPSPTVPEGRDILVSTVCTLPTHRGRGYGQAAFDAVMAWARTVGVRRVELMATASGRGMYERAGFREVTHPAMRVTFSS